MLNCSDGVVGYHARFTRARSRVRFPLRILLFFNLVVGNRSSRPQVHVLKAIDLHQRLHTNMLLQVLKWKGTMSTTANTGERLVSDSVSMGTGEGTL